MRFRIYFTSNEVEDYIELEAETLEGIKNKSDNYFKSRGFDIKNGNHVKKLNIWSEQLK